MPEKEEPPEKKTVVKEILAESAPWRARVVTLYPEMFPGPLGLALAGRALAQGVWALQTLPLRDFAFDRHKTVDDTPAGGGPGMVLKVDVLARSVDAAREGMAGAPVIALTPRGPRVTQARIRELVAGPGAIFLCGRFEGFDERLFAGRAVEPLSLGDMVLAGGEMAALAVIDACVRLLPGVMGRPASGDDESFEAGLLEYPQYTRPALWEGLGIPEVLTSGDHEKVARWRHARAVEDTGRWRPDLFGAGAPAGFSDGPECRATAPRPDPRSEE